MTATKNNSTVCRNYGLDLLKIIAIFFVILLHYNNSAMGGLLENVSAESNPVNYFISYIMQSISVIACDLFVIISGYYLCKDSKIKIRKAFDIIALLIFYGVAIYIFMLARGSISFGIESIQQLFLTIDARWFINVYLLLYVLHPFLNKAIQNISEKSFRYLVLICVVAFSIWSSPIFLSGFLNTKQFVKDDGYGITTFVMLYFIGAYIRLYKDNFKPKKMVLFILYLGITAVNTFVMIKWDRSSYNYILNVINTVILFLIFKNINIKKGKLISAIASMSLAVYIIHENSLFGGFLFKGVFKTELFYNSKWLAVHMIATAIGITAFCCVLEFIRRKLFKYTVDKVIGKSKFINKIINI